MGTQYSRHHNKSNEEPVQKITYIGSYGTPPNEQQSETAYFAREFTGNRFTNIR